MQGETVLALEKLSWTAPTRLGYPGAGSSSLGDGAFQAGAGVALGRTAGFWPVRRVSSLCRLVSGQHAMAPGTAGQIRRNRRDSRNAGTISARSSFSPATPPCLPEMLARSKVAQKDASLSTAVSAGDATVFRYPRRSPRICAGLGLRQSGVSGDTPRSADTGPALPYLARWLATLARSKPGQPSLSRGRSVSPGYTPMSPETNRLLAIQHRFPRGSRGSSPSRTVSRESSRFLPEKSQSLRSQPVPTRGRFIAGRLKAQSQPPPFAAACLSCRNAGTSGISPS